MHVTPRWFIFSFLFFFLSFKSLIGAEQKQKVYRYKPAVIYKPVPAAQSAAPVAGIVSATFYQEGAALYTKSGDFRITTDTEVDPNSQNQKISFYGDISKISNAEGVLWQVSRSPFPAFTGNPETEKNFEGLLLSGYGNGKHSSFNVDFRELSKKANPAGGHWQMQMYRVQSPLSFYVRILPVRSIMVPDIAGKPSNIIRVYYGKMPVQEQTPIYIPLPPPAPDPIKIRISRFQYFPFKYYCYVHSNPAYHGQFKGGNTYPHEEILKALADVWDWVASAYESAKGAVITVVASTLPMVPRDVIAAALDAAMIAAGIPPGIPNLNGLMDGGADYLAEQMIEQGGLPAGSALAKEQLKQAILSGANAARQSVSSAGPETQCAYRLDLPYVIVTIENYGNEDYESVYIGVNNTPGLFKSNAAQLKGKFRRGMRTGVPVVLSIVQREEFWDGQLYDERAQWDAYHSEKSIIKVSGSAYSPSQKQRTFFDSSYQSPARIWNEPFEQ